MRDLVLRSISLAGLATAAACSIFPNARKPASIVEALEVEYRFAADAPRTIEVPATRGDLTVLELHVDPAPRGERFERGHRILLLPGDCAHASLRCRLQRWAGDRGTDMSASQPPALFPGAAAVRFLDER